MVKTDKIIYGDTDSIYTNNKTYTGGRTNIPPTPFSGEASNTDFASMYPTAMEMNSNQSINKVSKDFSKDMEKDGWPYWLVYISMFTTLCILIPIGKVKGWFKRK